MKTYLLILSSMILICLTSCKKDECVSFGTVEYYPSFLWVDSNITPVTKTFDFDFSQDAKDDNSFAEFQFVDNEDKPISTYVMQVTIDGKEIANNKFRVNSDVTSKDLTFTFSPNAKEGKYQGYLKIISHALDRLDSQPLTSGQQVDVFQWTLYFDKVMNPLAKFLIWLANIIVLSLIIWLAVLKRIFFPRIRVLRLELSSRNGYYTNKKINGARKVVLTRHSKEQGLFSQLFKGKVLYIKNDIWTSPWELIPKGRKKVVKANLHGKYMIKPITSELAQFGEYQLTNIETKELVTIKIY